MDSTNIVTTVSHVTPEQVTQQFNAWMAVAALIGGVLWHMLLRVWPVLQKIYPYVVANGGVILIVKRFFYNPPAKTSETKTIQVRNVADEAQRYASLVDDVTNVSPAIESAPQPPKTGI